MRYKIWAENIKDEPENDKPELPFKSLKNITVPSILRLH